MKQLNCSVKEEGGGGEGGGTSANNANNNSRGGGWGTPKNTLKSAMYHLLGLYPHGTSDFMLQ